jgi:hypothetical protein
LRSYTGIFITLGGGPVNASSRKQSLVAKSSTEAELIGASDALPQILWTREFLIKPATLYQDNTSTIALIRKGRSTSARTKHIAIRYFFIKDREDAGEVTVEHMGTDAIAAIGLTKPLQGDAIRISRDRLMGGVMADSN